MDSIKHQQLNRASAVLAALLGAAVVIGRALLRQNVAPAVLYGFFGFTVLLAIAYLISVFCIKDRK